MKRGMKLTLFSLLGLAIIFGSIFIYRSQIRKVDVDEVKVEPQILSDTLMSKDDMKEDLDYLVETLKNVHPKALKGLSEEQNNIVKNSYAKIENPLKVGEFYFVVNEIACSFKDAHTSLYLYENDDDKVMDLPKVWLNDGMYIREDFQEFRKGDKIESIGGKAPNELLEELSKIIPAENQQWVKVMGNVALTKEPYLNYLEVIKDSKVNIEVLRDGEIVNMEIPLIRSKYSHTKSLNQNLTEKDWVKYNIDKENSLGVFTLSKCRNDEHYKSVLKDYFKDVQKNGIDNIVIDLRKNLGGDSGVTDEFLRYLDIDEYKNYGAEVRFSEEVRQQRGQASINEYMEYSSKYVGNTKINDEKIIFKGNIFILTSSITFSSGNWFAVIFKDNKIGTIVGEPTGNQPSSYGDILEFQMPNSRSIFTVSYKKFTRPDTSKDDENCLEPDIIVYTTIDDILNGRDPQMEKVLEIIKK